ncbi:MAG: leucine-rich repeat protein [Lachnospiraceae bacterium]|nr:leucine-rich repeat protein [Lachnospiraceae bacterium]
MQFRQDCLKRGLRGTVVGAIALLSAFILVLVMTPGAKASADETGVTLPQYVFRDETPDTNGIPKYYHKGIKYAELNDIEKLAFDQMVLLHLYLTDDPAYSALSQILGNDCFEMFDDVVKDKNTMKWSFKINLSSDSNFDIHEVIPTVAALNAVTGGAVSYNASNMPGENIELWLKANYFDYQKVVDALIIDIPDMFWWDKEKCLFTYDRLPSGESINIYNFVFNVGRRKYSKDDRGYYTSQKVLWAFYTAKEFAKKAIAWVEDYDFWEDAYIINSKLKPARNENYGKYVLTDYDKLRGIALLLGKIMKYDEENTLTGLLPTSFGIDCLLSAGEMSNGNLSIRELVEQGNNSVQAVCEGYSELYKFICDMTAFYNPVNVGIEVGYAGDSTKEYNTYGRHEWNVITIGGLGTFMSDITNDDENTYKNIKKKYGQEFSDKTYAYNNALFMKGKKNICGQLLDRGEYQIELIIPLVNEYEGAMKPAINYIWQHGPGPVSEAVKYDLSTEDASNLIRTESANIEVEDLRKVFNPRSIQYGNNYELNDSTFVGIDDRFYISVPDSGSASYRYEIVKNSGDNRGDIVPDFSGTLIKRETIDKDTNLNIYTAQIKNPFSLDSGYYSVYVYGTENGYVFPLKAASFEVKAFDILPRVEVPESLKEEEISSEDLKGKIVITVDGLAYGRNDDVSAKITNINSKVTKAATYEEDGQAELEITIELEGADAGKYKIDDNFYNNCDNKKVVKIPKKEKQNPQITLAPTAITGLTENGTEQSLINAGVVKGGTLYYAAAAGEKDAAPAESEFTTDIPKASGAGTFTVWYMVKGAEDYKDIPVQKFTVEIAEKKNDQPSGGSSTPSSGGSSTPIGGGSSTPSGGGSSTPSSGGSSTPSSGGSSTPSTGGTTDPSKKDEKTDSSQPKVTENEDGSKTTTTVEEKADGSTVTKEETTDKNGNTEIKEEVVETDGTTTTREETKNAKGEGTVKVVKEDSDGNVLSETKETTSVNKKGSVIVETVTENSDGSMVESTVKTTKSGNVTATIVETQADGSATTTNETVKNYASGSVKTTTETVEKDAKGNVLATVEKTVKVSKADAEGKVKTTASITETDADGKVTTTKETVVVDEKGKASVSSVTTNEDGTKVEKEITVSSKGTAKLAAIETVATEVEIPKAVEVAGKVCPVTSISKNAMKGNKTVTSVEIGENIKSIGAGAFKNSKNLATIELTDSITKISKNAFKGIAKNAVFKIKASSQKEFDRLVDLLKDSGVGEGVTFEFVEL